MAYVNSGKFNGAANGIYSGIPDLTFQGWKKGIFNKYPAMSIPKDALMDALNVDIHDDGIIEKRNGYTAISSTATHSCWSNETKSIGLFVQNSTLKYINQLNTVSELVFNLASNEPMTYCEVNNEIYFTNGMDSGKILSDFTLDKWILETPQHQAIVTVGVGNLPKGRYIVAYTYQYKDSESGSSPFTVVESMEDGISLNIQCQSNSDYTSNIYVSMANGEELFQIDNQGLDNYNFNLYDNSGIVLADEILKPFPLVEQLFYFRARIYGVKDNLLYFTDELNYRFYDERNPYWIFDDEIIIAAPATNGIYVVTKKATYFLSGNDHEDFVQTKILPTSAIKGSLFYDSSTTQMGFLSSDGYIALDGQGGAKNITSSYLDFSKNYKSCSTILMQQNGIEKIIFSMNERGENTTMQSTDNKDIKNDDV